MASSLARNVLRCAVWLSAKQQATPIACSHWLHQSQSSSREQALLHTTFRGALKQSQPYAAVSSHLGIAAGSASACLSTYTMAEEFNLCAGWGLHGSP
eukprot:1158086-Pelagomonas_calceolata.AAC.26